MRGVKLFVATDLSPSGDAAVATAMAWARRLGAELTLLHVVADPVLGPAFVDDVAGDLERARAALTAVAAAADVPCQVVVCAAEKVVDGILAACAGADYLFVGTQGKSAFERLRLGSVATAVMRGIAIPVVCVPLQPAA